MFLKVKGGFSGGGDRVGEVLVGVGGSRWKFGVLGIRYKFSFFIFCFVVRGWLFYSGFRGFRFLIFLVGMVRGVKIR